MAKLNCKEILNLIPLYLDNELTEKDAHSIRQHIARCDKCKMEADFLASLMKTASSLEDILPSEDFHHNLMEKVKKQKRSERIPFIKKYSPWLTATAAAIVLCIVGINQITAPPPVSQSKAAPPDTETRKSLPAAASKNGENLTSYIIAEIFVPYENKNAVMDILSPYEKDDTGYIVPDINYALDAISRITDADIKTTESTSAKNHYIVLHIS